VFYVKHTLRSLQSLRNKNEKITWLTCYDFSFATILEETELDMILVGDSGGMVMLGYKDTVPVTMDEMLTMCKSVRRGAPNKFLVGDMPKGSYEISNELAVSNAMRFVKEAGCDAIKLEGGVEIIERIKAIHQGGIATIGHIGLTPQSAGNLGGYRVIGRTKKEETKLLNSAKELEKAGAFAILVEAVPPLITKKITSSIDNLILGIGAGKFTHGQLLILHDLLGLYGEFRPKFAKSFIREVIKEFYEKYENYSLDFKTDGLRHLSKMAINEFIGSVKKQDFPNSTYSYSE
jgi:3-methyl-2-oxobutanoate hydroxymethyltransferase